MIRAEAKRAREIIGICPWQKILPLAICAALLLLPLGLITGTAHAAEIFALSPEGGPALVTVKGKLGLDDALRFTERTTDLEQAIVLFDSPGGNVLAGISIGKTLRRKGFVSAVPAAAQCASACALAWLGGTERMMAEDSRVGFHGAYVLKGGRPKKSKAAEPLIVDYLDELALTQRAVAYITRAQVRNISWLTIAAARDLGIEVAAYGPDVITGSTGKPLPVGSDIRRVRQLDLYGVNLPGMPVDVRNADECEMRCKDNDACAAFTFNEAHSACFLKTSAEFAVSHPQAISGYRLRLEKRIRRIAMAIQEATDYPGNDIDRRKSTTFEACLVTCSGKRTCKAFTYVVRRHECWLKNAKGSAEPREGLVSGVK
jgi:hypothetical protein